MAKVKTNEQYVKELFWVRYHIDLLKIEEGTRKTPDFEYVENGKRVFVCEVKNVNHNWPSEKSGWKSTGQIDGTTFWERADNAPNRIAKKIDEAYDQLDRYTEPKILILINEDGSVDINDLNEAYDGHLIYANESHACKNTVSRRIAEGRIKHKKNKIDLYIWIDKGDNDDAKFRFTSHLGKKIAEDYFKKRDLSARVK
ncbi:MAG: hypothetical protein SVM79_09740 [Chloroflexota bacterium]|nr:hypothetical protein [Chloroflexota bacterium]